MRTRTRTARSLVPSMALFVGSFAPLEAHAAEPPAIVEIAYSAPPECPDRAAFIEQVLRRTPGVRLATDGETAPEFHVVVEPVAEGNRARLAFVDADARPVLRELVARDCTELVASMAVVVALAIDPRFSDGEDAELPEPEPVAAPAPSVERPRQATAPVAAPPPKDAQRDASWLLGASGGVVSDIAPDWSPSALVFSDLGLGGDFRVRLSLGYAASGQVALGDALARFSLAAGRAELCPLAARPFEALALRPCGGFELGTYHAEGEQSARVTEPKSSSDPWLAATLALRAELDISDSFVLGLEGELRAPLLRRTYVFERPAATAYETPALGVGAKVALSIVVFP